MWGVLYDLNDLLFFLTFPPTAWAIRPRIGVEHRELHC